MINSLLKACLKKIRSGTCLLCEEPTYRRLDLCKTCEVELPYLTHACVQCALPLPPQNEDKYCGVCLQAPLEAYQVFSTFIYSLPIDRLIMELKFKHRLTAAAVLGQLMVTRIEQIYQVRTYPEVIIPIPLHSGRLRERGFNQALELARPISRALSIPLDYRRCFRVKQTAAQTGLSAKERAKNVKHAFTVQKPFSFDHVCLIDDVCTTGHTAMALAKVLFQSGVKTVDVWCCARASLKF